MAFHRTKSPTVHKTVSADLDRPDSIRGLIALCMDGIFLFSINVQHKFDSRYDIKPAALWKNGGFPQFLEEYLIRFHCLC